MTRLILAQINPTVGALEENRRKIVSTIHSAEQGGADFVLFPELAVTGYPPEDLLFKNHFISATEKAVDDIVRATGKVCAIFGAPVREDSALYNSAIVAQGGKVLAVIHKSHLPNYGVFDEKRYFQPGTNNRPVLVNGQKIAITVCEDIWVKDGLPAEVCANPDVDMILNLSSSPFHIGKVQERRSTAVAWAKRFNKPLAYCNLVGGQDELVFDGGSFVCSSAGTVSVSAEEFKEEQLEAVIAGDGTVTGDHCAPLLAYPEDLFEALKMGVGDYVRKNGFKKTLVALSGGIDSALTAHIGVSVLGPENLDGVALPSRYSSEGSLADAKELAENLGIAFSVIPITPLMDAFDDSLKETFAGTTPGLAEENIQARIRGNLMMAISNKFGHLLLTTGNKSEMSVGYCTLYGDMAGGFSVLRDVPKLMVYDLARWINTKEGLPRIPVSSIEKPPSAELRPDQKDSDSLPEYYVLDPILKAYVEEEKSIEEIMSLGYSGREVERVVRLVDLNEYKRRQAAPGVRITPKAFGKDRRMPVTNRFIKGQPGGK